MVVVVVAVVVVVVVVVVKVVVVVLVVVVIVVVVVVVIFSRGGACEACDRITGICFDNAICNNSSRKSITSGKFCRRRWRTMEKNSIHIFIDTNFDPSSIANSLLVVVLFVVLFLVVVVVLFYFLYEVLHIRKKQNIKSYLNMFHLYAHSLPLIHST